MNSIAINQQIQTSHEVIAKDLPLEFMMNAMRLVDGFNLTLFNQTTGLPLSNILSKLTELQRQQLIQISHNHLKPTSRGLDYLNNLLELLLE